MEKIEYIPSEESKLNEEAVKNPLIEEHNIMGAKFRNKEISVNEWKLFEKDWLARFQVAMTNVVKNRVYVENIIL